jgi:hypothetical protein
MQTASMVPMAEDDGWLTHPSLTHRLLSSTTPGCNRPFALETLRALACPRQSGAMDEPP